MKDSKCPDCKRNYKLIFKEIRTNFRCIDIVRKYQCECSIEQLLRGCRTGTAYNKVELLKILNTVEILRVGDEMEFCEKIINRVQI